MNVSSFGWLARLRTALLLIPALFAGHAALAQATGSVGGRVSDRATEKSLHGAIVRVVGTGIVDYTDADGRYLLSAVPAGSQRVEVEYVGLDAQILPVTVSAGQAATLNAALDSKALQLEAFTVSESARGQALAINQQKTASGIVNVISEEVFGQMIDNNIGVALQRLPGISVDENQDGQATGFNIRGIEGEYNSFQIDGNRAPNSGSTSRAFNATQFDASGVTNIEVIKAPTPDRDGDAIGGIINVVSRSAFQRDGRDVKLKMSGVYSDLPEKWGHAAALSFSDIFSVHGKEKNLGVAATLSSNRTNRYSTNADIDWVKVTPANNPTLNLGQYGDQPVWFMESSHWEYATRITDTWGLSGSIDLRTDEHNSFYVRPSFSHYSRKGVAYETDIDIDTRFQDAANGRKTYAALTPNSGRGTPGNSGSRASRGWIGTDLDEANDLSSISFGGRHEKDVNLITWDLFYSRSENTVSNDTELNMLMEPTNPWFVFEYQMVKASEGLVHMNVINGVDSSDLSLMTEGELEEVSSKKIEDAYSARLDWERTFALEQGAFALKTGAKYRRSEPRFDRHVTVYTMDENFPYERVVTPTDAVLFLKPKYFDVHPRQGQALLRSNPELFELDEEATLEDGNLADYTAKESTTAAYAMGTYRFGAHTVIGGVRVEANEWSSRNKRTSFLNGVGRVTEVNHGASYTRWLPGLHFRHELRKNLILRESFNQSYGRPRFSQLTRGRFENEDGDIVDGNPNLKPASSNNYDVNLEYYVGNGGLYSVGVFYKDVKDFTYDRVYNFNVLDANGIPIMDEDGDLEYEVPANGSSAKNMGVEIIARQRLTFLPGPLKGFTAAISATFADTEAKYPDRTDRDDLPLPGFSKHLFTSSLEYARGRFFARADYRYRDDYVEGLGSSVDTDEFYAAEEKVDLELAYRLRQGLTLFAHGTNLTNRPQVSYSGYRQFVEDASLSGPKYTFGIEYKY